METRLRDELNDVVNYTEMAKHADTEFDRRILSDIARDEFSHAKHIKEIMKEHGIHADVSEEWKKAEKSINELDTIQY